MNESNTFTCTCCGKTKPIGKQSAEVSGVCKKCNIKRKKAELRKLGITDYKVCTRCEMVKPVSAFSKCTNSKDGLYCQCKDCVSVVNKIQIDRRKNLVEAENRNHCSEKQLSILFDPDSVPEELRNPEMVDDTVLQEENWSDMPIEELKAVIWDAVYNLIRTTGKVLTEFDKRITLQGPGKPDNE